MAPAGRETEIKRPFASPAEAEERLVSIGAKREGDREFEENVLYVSLATTSSALADNELRRE